MSDEKTENNLEPVQEDHPISTEIVEVVDNLELTDQDGNDDVEVVLEVKSYNSGCISEDKDKLSLLKNIGLFLGMSSPQVFKDDSILVGSSLLRWLEEWFPDMDHEFLKGMSESQAVRNCQQSLSDIYQSISVGPFGDHTISTESEMSNDLTSILYGEGITSKFPYTRLRMTPESLISEQQKLSTFEKATFTDVLLDEVYRYAENIYLKRYHIKANFLFNWRTSCTCPLPPLSETHTIERIDFISHPKLFEEYEEMKEMFRSNKKAINERLLFHGTHATNLHKILQDNFKISADPVRRKKTNSYGTGIYFSDYPAQSLKYGEALLLCKVILGKEQVLQLGKNPTEGQENVFKTKDFNSRKMVDQLNHKDVPAKVYMVPEPQQVLPCYVIYLRKRDAYFFEHECKASTAQLLSSAMPSVSALANNFFPNPIGSLFQAPSTSSVTAAANISAVRPINIDKSTFEPNDNSSHIIGAFQNPSFGLFGYLSQQYNASLKNKGVGKNSNLTKTPSSTIIPQIQEPPKKNLNSARRHNLQERIDNFIKSNKHSIHVSFGHTAMSISKDQLTKLLDLSKLPHGYLPNPEDFRLQV